MPTIPLSLILKTDKNANAKAPLCLGCFCCASARAASCGIVCADGTGWDDRSDSYRDCVSKCTMSTFTNFSNQPTSLSCYDVTCGGVCVACAGRAISRVLQKAPTCKAITKAYHIPCNAPTRCDNPSLPPEILRQNIATLTACITMRTAGLAICRTPDDKNHIEIIGSKIKNLQKCLKRNGYQNIRDVLDEDIFSEFERMKRLFPGLIPTI